MNAPAHHIEVIDALGGMGRLTARSPTLDGSVPLRVAQGCVPLLDGNAHGLQVSLRLAWRLRRSLGRWRVAPVAAHETVSGWGLPAPTTAPDPHAKADALVRARVTTLVARRWLPEGGFWHRALTGVVQVASSPRGAVARVFTGLLVRPVEGCALRVTRCSNRRSAAYDVIETVYADASRFTPLVVDCLPSPGARDFVIEGELATLSALPRGAKVVGAALEDRPEVGRTHLDFYDRSYFEEKRQGDVTRKYRKLFGGSDVASSAPDAEIRTVVVAAGTGSYGTESSVCLATIEGLSEGTSPCASVSFANEVAFTARWDGARVGIEWDREALDARARAIEARWRALYPEARGREAEGALWYLTKYFTPHPVGEPHFFVKPCSFVVTPDGWSSLVEGDVGEGYDVLRGVVHTDRFHATPAVFALRAPGEVRVPAGRRLIRVFPLPREMSSPRFTARPFDEALPP